MPKTKNEVVDMPRPKTLPTFRFSKKSIDALPFSSTTTKQDLYRDEDLKGLYLVVSSSRKSFRLNVHVKKLGRSQNIAIGPYPDMTVEQARAKASALLSDIAHGRDPVAEQKEQEARAKEKEELAKAQAATLREARDAYISDRISAGRLRQTTANSKYIYDFNLYGKDLLDLPLNQITGEKIEEIIRRLRAEPGRHGRGRETSLGIFLRNLRAILRNANERYSTPERLLFPKGIPTARVMNLGILRKSKPKQRALTTKELPVFYRYLYLKSSFFNPKEGQAVADCFIFALLTGAREGEIVELEWKDVEGLEGDLNAASVKFLDTKTHDDRLIPVGPVLADLLKRRRDMLGRAERYVFPSYGKTGHLVETKNLPKDFLEKNPDFKSFSIHDMRRTFTSHGRNEVDDKSIMSTLDGHKDKNNTTERHYTIIGEEISPDLRDAINAIETCILQKCKHEELQKEFAGGEKVLRKF
ncbi:MAG: tyrosine-type recombinase/integrase [Leptospirales bacterium]